MKKTYLFIILLLLFSMSNYGQDTPDITNLTITVPSNVVITKFVGTATDVVLSNPTTADNYTVASVTNKQPSIVKENNTSSIFLKKRETAKETSADTRPKIRLGFDSTVGAHRQLLVGVDSNATNSFDLGYDAPMFDTNDNDMYWIISEGQFVIQGVPDFDLDQILPIGIVTAKAGEVNITIDKLENIPLSTKIYLYDNKTDIYHDLRNSDFKTTLEIGEYNKRFSLRFNIKQGLNVIENKSNNEIKVFYSNKTLNINNTTIDTNVKTVSLFNILGQSIGNWDVNDKEQTNIQIPINNISSGIYITKTKTSKGWLNNKIIIN